MKCLLNNKHNHITTTYYLLYQKYERLGLIKKEDDRLVSEEDEDMRYNKNSMVENQEYSLEQN